MKRKILYIFFILIFSQVFIFSEENALTLLKETEYKCIPYICDFKWDLKVFYDDGFNSETKFLSKKNKESEFMFYTYYPYQGFGNVYLRIKDSIYNYYPLADITTRTVMRSNILDSNLAYFDVLFDDLLENYSAKVLSKDKNSTCIELNIQQTKNINDFYPKVLLFIDNNTKTTTKREYYSKENKLLKTISFFSYTFKDNKIKSFSMKIENTMQKEQYTTADFYDIDEKESIDKKYFNIGFLKNWMPDLEGVE